MIHENGPADVLTYEYGVPKEVPPLAIKGGVAALIFLVLCCCLRCCCGAKRRRKR